MAATMRNPKKRRGVLEKSCQAKKASAGRAAALAVRYGGLGFSPTSRKRAVFSPEKIARFAERVPRGIACYVFRGIRNYRNLSKTLDFMQLFGGVQLIPGFEQQLLFLP